VPRLCQPGGSAPAPADTAGAPLVAALWKRDGRPTRHALGLTADEVSKQEAAWRQEDFVPLDVAAYLVDAAPRYALLAVQADADYPDAKLYVGVAEKAHDKAWQPLKKAGFAPRTVTSCEVDGQPQYSGVWWKPAQPREDMAADLPPRLDGPRVWWKPAQPSEDMGFYWAQDQAEYESELSPSRLQLDVRLSAVPRRLRQAWQEFLAALAVVPRGSGAALPWGPLVLSRQWQEAGPLDREYAQVYEHHAELVSEESHGLDARQHL
jgi:hypothetical protein